eukprot:14409309-Ditylum_brightwellii.AAC.2
MAEAQKGKEDNSKTNNQMETGTNQTKGTDKGKQMPANRAGQKNGGNTYAQTIQQALHEPIKKKHTITVGTITRDKHIRLNLIYHTGINRSNQSQDYIKEACSDIAAAAMENV